MTICAGAPSRDPDPAMVTANRSTLPGPTREIYTISRLNREARAILESEFPPIWVQGEVSNLARPSSGHIYFTLKDAFAQVRCAMFRSRNQSLGFEPHAGRQVVALARVSLYENRGEFQLIVEHLEEAGAGALRQAFELLKQKLAGEGLFAVERKRPVPRFPQRIGVITSPSGAAIRDILSVHRRRFPGIPVLVYPVPVQGEGAAMEIARTIHLASTRRECDVLIVARGGGSLEDLWAFNEETVARAIFECAIPVVCGIGHEIDFTIADLVADQRAPTPSAAAELVTPDRDECSGRFTGLRARMLRVWERQIRQRREALERLSERLALQHPGQRLRERAQRLDELEQRLLQSARLQLLHRSAGLRELATRMQLLTPIHTITHLDARAALLSRRLRSALEQRLLAHRLRLQALGRALEAVSPLATLGRGYAIVARDRDGAILRDAEDVSVNEQVRVQLARGHLLCCVEHKRSA
jgi:exodeoxyribonuclease VII large subunit